jgi:TIR domain
MARIFISYRRADSGASAGRLHDRLREHFGRDNVFMDIDTIEPGLDFTEVIERTVASCDVLIALIGRQWLTSTDAAGQRRLDDPEDFVRREVATALRRHIRVIPVLIQGTPMPRAADLPDELQPLTRRNALDLSDTHFHRDVDELIVVLDRVLGVTPSPAAPVETELPHVLSPVRSSYLRSWKLWGLACLLLAGIAFIVVFSVVPLERVQTSSSPPSPATESPPQPSDQSLTLQPPPPTSTSPTQAPTVNITGAQARRVSEQFAKTLLNKDLEGVMNLVATPWFDQGGVFGVTLAHARQPRLIHDAAELKSELNKVLAAWAHREAPKEVYVHIPESRPFGAVLAEAKKESDPLLQEILEMLEEVLRDTDRIVTTAVATVDENEAKVGALLVGMRDGQPKVVGILGF